MDYANLYIGGTEVFTNATFVRIPAVDEFVAYDGHWRRVTVVGHTWSDSSNAPVVCIDLGDPQGPSEVNFQAGRSIAPAD